MSDLVRRAVCIDANKAGNASHPLTLIGRVASRAPNERREGLVARQLGNLTQAQCLHGCVGDRLRKRGASLVDHALVEHRAGTELDPLDEYLAGDGEPEDECGMASFLSPEPVRLRS